MEARGQPDDREATAAVTRLLARVRSGDLAARDELAPLVYAELRSLARAVFAGQHRSHTLQPTALVHEAWLKLAGHMQHIDDRRHFFIVAGKAMRQVITDHARGQARHKRGGALRQVTLDTSLAATDERSVDLVDLDDSLRRLAECNERHARVAELRLFSGLSIAETAEALGISPRSVDTDWAMAKAWLRRDFAASR